jgi:precorrin-8X/cobalt-precorrin-8 methylmutase
MLDYIRDPAEITRRSFEMIAAEADLASLPADIRPVAARIVHACGMTDVVADLDYSPGAGATGVAALKRGACILCDVRMVASGVMRRKLAAKNVIDVAIDAPGAEELARESGQTRSAAGMKLCAGRLAGAVVVVGNAPTALFRLIELVSERATAPAVVLGFPVGFVGAAESKAALAASGLPFITLHGRRGGSAVAAAALNALILGNQP